MWGDISWWFWNAFSWWIVSYSTFFNVLVCYLYVCFSKKIYVVLLLMFLIRIFCCWIVSRLCILDINSLSDTWFANIFSHSIGCLFILLPTDVGNLISGSSAFSISNLYIWKFSAHILLKPSCKDFVHHLASMWNECSSTVVWTFFDCILLWDCSENWPFPVLWPLLSFPNLLAYWVQHFHSIMLYLLGTEIAQLEFRHLH